MDLRIFVGDGFQQLAVAVVNQHPGRTLCADIEKPGLIGGDAAVGAAKRFSRRQFAPVRNHAIGPFAIASLKLW